MKHFSILFAALLLAAGAASAQGLPGEGAQRAYLDSCYRYDASALRFFFNEHTFNPDGSLQKDCVLLRLDTLMPCWLYEYSYTADGRLNGYTAMKRWNDPWKGSKKYDLTFNAEGLVEDSIDYAYNNNVWSPRYKFSYTYDAGRISSILTYNYEEQSWVEDFRQDFTYNADGKLLNWNGYERIGGDWQWSYTKEKTYDDRGRLILHLENSSSGSKWRTEYTYHSDTTYTVLYSYKRSDDADFGLKEKNECTIDAAGRVVHRITYYIEDDGVSWRNYGIDKYAYNDRGQEYDYELYLWQNGVWAGWQKRTVTAYDAFGHELEVEVGNRYSYNQTTQQFSVAYTEKYFYTYVYPAALDAVDADAPAQKFFRDGRILIRRGDRIYDLNGRMVE